MRQLTYRDVPWLWLITAAFVEFIARALHAPELKPVTGTMLLAAWIQFNANMQKLRNDWYEERLTELESQLEEVWGVLDEDTEGVQ